MLGMVATPVLPVTGTVCIRRSGNYADSVTRLAEADPRVLRILEKMLQGSAYAEVGFMAGTLLVAVAVDRRLLAADSLPARGLIGPEVHHVLQMQAEQRRHEEAAPEHTPQNGVPAFT